MHDQWNSGSMHVYRLIVQDYYASTMHARWQNLIYFLLAVITNTVHLTSGFFARIFYRHFSLQ